MTRPAIYFVGMTPLGMLPLMRYIVPLFRDEQVMVLTIHVKQSYRYDEFAIQKDIMVFEDTDDLNQHTLLNKLKKYIAFTAQILLTFTRNKDCIVYTVDYQVAALLLWIKKVINPKLRLVYHQFEAFEISQSSGINRMTQSYVLKNTSCIDLTIFPEINRLNYFANMANESQLNALLFPNTNNLLLMRKKANGSLHAIKKEKTIIAHIGNLGAAHYAFSFFRFIRTNNQPDLKFLFIGKVDEEANQELQKLAKEDSRVEVIGEIPHTQLLPYYAAIDLGVILYKGIDLNNEYCAPNKLYEYWSQGIPVLAHTLKGLQSIWTHHFMGELVDMDNPHQVQDGINQMMSALSVTPNLLRSWFEKEAMVDIYLDQLKAKMTTI